MRNYISKSVVFRILKMLFTEPSLFLNKLNKKIYLMRLKYRDPFAYRKEIWRYFGLNIGESSKIYPGVEFFSEPYLVEIGENVILAANVKFLTHDGSPLIFRQELGFKEIFGRIVVGNNVFIGMNTYVLPNVKIGSDVIIGANSVVTKNIPSGYIALGNPAKPIIKTSIYKNFIKNNKNLFDSMHLNDEFNAVEILISHFNIEMANLPDNFKYKTNK